MNWKYYWPKFEYEEIFPDASWPWAGHKFFAYDLILNYRLQTVVELGTHKGTSFFSFCQGIKDNGLSAKLFAIDTWRGDSHAGQYDDEVLNQVKKIIETYYSNTETELLQMTFDEAVLKFEDNSIDLLHIDGYHTYEAVKHDFTTWFNKVAYNGIILFHDIEVSEKDFGVYKFWEELKQKFVTIEFHHSYGLGVLFKNPQFGNELKKMQSEWQRHYSFLHERLSQGKIISLANDLEKIKSDLRQQKKDIEQDRRINQQNKQIINKQISQIIDLQQKTVDDRTVINIAQIVTANQQNQLEEFKQQIIEKDILIESEHKLMEELRNSNRYKDSQIEDKQKRLDIVSNNITSKIQKKIDNLLDLLLGKDTKLRLGYQHLLVGLNHFLSQIASKRAREYFAILDFPLATQPDVSIIIPVYNQFSYTYNCLKSILVSEPKLNYEIIIADDGSTDKTRKIKKYCKNITVIKNSKNLGFIKNCNLASTAVRGKYILFLNNDTEVLPLAISYLLDTIRADDKIGAVGGKIILSDQTLQEAGSIIWRDGSCLGYGRGDSPLKPEYLYVREVDYCSGAFLLTPRKLFLGLGKFDEQFAPAYYEDTDYCTSVINSGYKVIYQPLATIIHYESVSHGEKQTIDLQNKNCQRFKNKWINYLEKKPAPDSSNVLMARDVKNYNSRILIVDDKAPDPRFGAGYPRAAGILSILLEQGNFVTFFPTTVDYKEESDYIRKMQQAGVEVIANSLNLSQNFLDFEGFISSRENFYDYILVSRPHNMERVKDHLDKGAKTKIIYDAEAIFALRDLNYRRLNGEIVTSESEFNAIDEELSLTKKAGMVVTVSEDEKRVFFDHGIKDVCVIGHMIEPKPTSNIFEQRRDILFVGAICSEEPNNPNFDSIVYFIEEIFPLVTKQIDCRLLIVGLNNSARLKNLESDKIKIVGPVDDLDEYYNNCRVFVAPTRFAAGIPIKVHDASAYGLPCVITPLLGQQLGWTDEKECLIGDSPLVFAQKVVNLYQDKNLWAKIRANSTEAVTRECSPEIMKKKILNIFS